MTESRVSIWHHLILIVIKVSKSPGILNLDVHWSHSESFKIYRCYTIPKVLICWYGVQPDIQKFYNPPRVEDSQGWKRGLQLFGGGGPERWLARVTPGVLLTLWCLGTFSQWPWEGPGIYFIRTLRFFYCKLRWRVFFSSQGFSDFVGH